MTLKIHHSLTLCLYIMSQKWVTVKNRHFSFSILFFLAHCEKKYLQKKLNPISNLIFCPILACLKRFSGGPVKVKSWKLLVKIPQNSRKIT